MTTEREEQLSDAEEEYLESIYHLTRDGQTARTEQLAAAMGVSAPAATGMLKRLAARGSLDHEPYAGAQLTEKGEKQALGVVRRHRLLERLLTDILHLPWHSVHEQACKLEHSVSPEMEQRLEAVLADPETCPHGHPIPAADGSVDDLKGVTLDTVRPGSHATILRIEMEESDLLKYIGSLGMFPQVEVVVEASAPFDGPLMVRVGEAYYALGREVARLIVVEPLPEPRPEPKPAPVQSGKDRRQRLRRGQRGFSAHFTSMSTIPGNTDGSD